VPIKIESDLRAASSYTEPYNIAGGRKMNEAQAIRIAVQYLDENPLDHPSYEWELRDWAERDDDWLFQFCYRAKTDIPPEQWEQFGGAPAFVVSKTDGSIRILSWDEYS